LKINNQIVIETARELGFDLIGFAKADNLKNETDHLKKWLELGYHASMDYMAKNFDKRLDVKNVLPNAQSIISLAMNYYTDHQYSNEKSLGKVSRYAWGKDYHLIIWQKLELLEEKFKKIDNTFEGLSYVDTGPVMDKTWAVHAGIGWMGKHSNIITKEMGSWIFLATIITNCEFDYSKPVNDLCGTCTACINACPTRAIVNDYIIDASKCISFLTIENKKEIPEKFKNQFDGWLFGCDTCQDVCPWNKKLSVQTNIKEFEPIHKEIPLHEISSMKDDVFKDRFETSPIKRTKPSGLKRNAFFLEK
jgi:epoxyqueuosine reductase